MRSLPRKTRLAVIGGWIAIILLLFLAIIVKNMLARPINVILVSIDALRADHLGCYGYPKPTSPCIDALAAENVLFKNAYSPQPWTLPAHFSMLTSLYPDAHNVMDENARLSSKWLTLAEVLKKKGYLTAGFASCPDWLGKKYGYGRGFDYFRAKYEAGNVVNEEIEDYLRRNEGLPIFLFIHYFDVHTTAASEQRGNFPYYAPEELRALFMPKGPRLFTGGGGKLWAASYLSYCEENGVILNAREKEELCALYDASVRLVDSHIAQLIAVLKEKKIFDKSLIIITADHGEELLDHNHYQHLQLYEEVLHVPLIVKLPKRSYAPGIRINTPQTIDAFVSLIDIMPTILDCLKIPLPQDQIQGQSLLQLMRGKKGARDYSCASLYDHPHKTFRLAARDSKWKLLLTGEENPVVELYHLTADPHEHNNVADKHPDVVNRIRDEARAWQETNRAKRQKVETRGEGLTKEERERLRSLGYMTK